ncbi:inositol monophosphatase family protein [Paenibacillaceae sp. P-4]|uniref:inositol monophosphatase family protein n=1 Tax=Paenibacillaceae bacterium P-4 TaxID=3160969 RepID=UPI0032E80563
MNQHVIQDAREVAIEAARQAGLAIKQLFDQVAHVEMKDEHGDVVTEADLLAEAIIVKEIQAAFPDHQIHSEEAGVIGVSSDWQWLVDPLDGTNNFAIGIPLFSCSITVMYQQEPVVGVVYEPMTDRLFHAAVGNGAYCNDQRMQVKSCPSLHKGNIGWIQGHKVQQDPIAVGLRHYIDTRCKRMMRLWAPTLQWCMLAKGDLDGIVLYKSEGDDLYSGILMVKEAGGSVIDFNGETFTGMNSEPYLIACHPDHEQELLRMVRTGISVPVRP